MIGNQHNCAQFVTCALQQIIEHVLLLKLGSLRAKTRRVDKQDDTSTYAFIDRLNTYNTDLAINTPAILRIDVQMSTLAVTVGHG